MENLGIGIDWLGSFQKPGEIEGELAEIGTERVLKEFLAYRKPAPFFLPKGKCFAGPVDLPEWLSPEDFRYYVTKFQKTGFTGGLNYYRNIDRCVFSSLLLSISFKISFLIFLSL